MSRKSATSRLNKQLPSPAETTAAVAQPSASPEFPRGTICSCTPEDRPALANLYQASYPEATFKDFMAGLNDSEIPYWSAFKDAEGRLRVAMFAWRNGVVWVMANPDDAESEEVRRGFLRLAEDARARLASVGVTDLFVAHTATLNRFGEILEHAGFLGKPYMVMRMMHFTDSGKGQRAI